MTVSFQLKAANGATVPITMPSYSVAASASAPLSWGDPIFSNVVNSNAISVPTGGTISNKSITDSGSIASVLFNGPGFMDHVRIKSREGVRIGGGGTVRIDSSWIETNGVGSDHADSIQAYSPGDRGTIWITNSTIRAYRSGEISGKIGSVGMFVADNWTGGVTLENVIVWGGQFGLRLHADTGGDILVSLKDVYFIGQFASDAFYFLDYGGHRCIVTKWENVREATIVNGVLVPGALIPSP